MQTKNNKLVIYETADGQVHLDVNVDAETVWLNRQQLSDLFDRDIKTIGKHINNALKEELNGISVVAKIATTAADGKVYKVAYYDLDLIISVGYRVNSKRGVEFRRWANNVLKNYITKGYAINNDRLKQLKTAIQVMKRTYDQLDSGQILDVIESYTLALDMLDDYDHNRLEKPTGKKEIYRLAYKECRQLIDDMKFNNDSEIFGNEKDESFQSSINAIYQTFGTNDLYPSLEEKAANLLYFITKNHSFIDGNKRIAATIFIYFLNKNNGLYLYGKKVIEDHTLVALIIMISESKPEEKETMIKLVMNFINSGN